MLSLEHISWICLPLFTCSSHQRLQAAGRLSELWPYTGYSVFYQGTFSAENTGISNKTTGNTFLKGLEEGVIYIASPS